MYSYVLYIFLGEGGGKYVLIYIVYFPGGRGYICINIHILHIFLWEGCTYVLIYIVYFPGGRGYIYINIYCIISLGTYVLIYIVCIFSRGKGVHLCKY